MATVPRSDQFGNLRGARPGIPSQGGNVPSLAAFGGDTRDIEFAANFLGQAGSALFQENQRIKAQNTAVRLDEGMNSAREKTNFFLNNSNDGIYRREGSDAQNSGDLARVFMDTLGPEIKSTLPKNTHTAFDLQFGNLSTRTLNQVGEFQLGQHEIHMSDTIDSTRESLKRQVFLNSSQNQIDSAIDDFMETLTFTEPNPETRKQMLGEFKSDIHEQVVNSKLLGKKYAEAQTYFDANVEEIDPDKLPTITRTLTQYRDRQSGFDFADRLEQILGPSASFNDYADLADELVRLGTGRIAELSQKAKDIRPVARRNTDGTESTVLMSSVEVDGRNFAVPTLFPRDPGSETSDPQDFIELEGLEAFKEAKKRGELFEFQTAEEADEFARGIFKQVGVGIDVRDRGMARIANRMRRRRDEQGAIDKARLDTISDRIALGEKLDDMSEEDILWLTQKGQYAEMVLAEQKVSAGEIKKTDAQYFKGVMAGARENPKTFLEYSPWRDPRISPEDAAKISTVQKQLRDPKTAATADAAVFTENKWTERHLDRIKGGEENEDEFIARYNEAIQFLKNSKRQKGENPNLTDDELMTLGNELRAKVVVDRPFSVDVGRFNPLRVLPFVSFNEREAFLLPPEERTIDGAPVKQEVFNQVQSAITEAGIEDQSEDFTRALERVSREAGLSGINQLTAEEIQIVLEDFTESRTIPEQAVRDLAEAQEQDEEAVRERIRVLEEDRAIPDVSDKELTRLKARLKQIQESGQ